MIEDNAYGISVDKKTSTAVARNDIRAAGYAMPGIYVEGNDPDAIFAAAGEAVDRARKGGGPSLIEIETDRLTGHFTGDPETYRPAGEKEKITQRDAVPALREKLLSDGVASPDAIAAMEARAEARVSEAIEFARAAPEPAPEDALTKVFA